MGGGGLVVTCKNTNCESIFYILIGNFKSFYVRFTDKTGKCFTPKLETHPRKNIPAWGAREDKRSPKTGEFFTNPSQSEYRHGLCFICKDVCRLPIDIEWPMKNLFSVSFKTPCEEAAKRIQKIFEANGLCINTVGSGEEYPPSFYLINVSSCVAHKPNLLELQKVAREKGVINKKILSKIKALK
ncbi:MAG: hypothetical protein UT29_C0001G0116 [Candidatus Yanofskybacteria bacterium GW2011_GWA1_39_13]|uniref:Uncharacterized protein n=1 Tax=Yanofskybacteria sp. (strain GW2011_GWA1_39_13) TaxID=1619019 RepID=A0A0G0MQC3_YANXG|nr:MAG: hypothetical protein UT29_C0001G0116 [Candidatus Yanofskybacteria bacterium GW2011_GWA1_39_13]